MSSVVLDKVWINDAADYSDAVSFFSAERSDSRTVGGEVRSYAGGRTRIITRPSRTQTLGVTAMLLTDTQVEWLDAHAGHLVLLRDHRGRKVWGTFFTLGVVDRKSGGADVPFVFTQVTHTDEV